MTLSEPLNSKKHSMLVCMNLSQFIITAFQGLCLASPAVRVRWRGARLPFGLPSTTITPPLVPRVSGQKSPNWDGTQQHPACDSPAQEAAVTELAQALSDAKTTSQREPSMTAFLTPVRTIPPTP